MSKGSENGTARASPRTLKKVYLLEFPNEILLHIVDLVESEKDLHSLTQVTQRFYDLVEPALVRHNIQKSRSSALLWAAMHGDMKLLTRLLRFNADVTTTLHVRRFKTPAASSRSRKLLPFFHDTGRTALHLAAEAGHRQIVRLLLHTPRVKADIGCFRSEPSNEFRAMWEGRTPLSFAAGNGHFEIVRMLLWSGRVNTDSHTTSTSNDDPPRTPLSFAALGGHAKVVRLLLNHGASSEAPQPNGETPMHCAARCGHVQIVKALLAAGANPDPVETLPTGAASTPVRRAIENSHEQVVAQLLATESVDVHRWDQTAFSLLVDGASLGGEGVFLRIYRAYNGNIPKGHLERSLYMAAMYGNTQIVRFILSVGISPNANDQFEIPLLGAAGCGQAGVVNILLDAGADPFVIDFNGDTILHRLSYAYYRPGELGLMSKVVKRVLAIDGMNPEAKNNDGQTPLYCAVTRCDYKMIEKLLSTGRIDTNAIAWRRGHMPLLAAMSTNKKRAVETLLPKYAIKPSLR